MNRTKTTTYNSITAFISIVFVYLANFIYRTLLIKVLGIQYAGITGLFGNILSIFSLSELGIGSAITVALYKALGNNDNNKIVSLLRFLKLTYKYVSIFILIVGLIFLPFITRIIKNDVSFTNIYVVYLLFLLNIVLSYAFFSYYQILIVADRKGYKLFFPQTIIPLITLIFQIIAMFLTHNFLIIIAISSINVFLSNLWMMKIVKNTYPYLYLNNKEMKLDNNEIEWLKSYIKASFFYKISEKIMYSTDGIVISTYLGLTELGFFSNYILIIDTIRTLVLAIIRPFTQAIGNLFVTAKKGYQEIMIDRLNFFNFWVTGFCTICFAVLLNPFIEIWLGTEFQVEKKVYYLLIINFYIEFMQNFIMMYRDACGLNIYGRFRPLITAIINIVLSILFVQSIGLAGVLLGAFISRMITIFWYEPFLVYDRVIKKAPTKYFFSYIFNTLIVLLCIFLIKILFNYFWKHTIITFAYGLLLCLVIPNLIYWLIYRKNKNYLYYIQYFKSFFKGKFEEINTDK